MLAKPCARCGRLVPYGSAYCPPCGHIAQRQREERSRERKRRGDRAYNAKRDPKYARFYASADWKRTSRAKMSDARWRCERCGGIAAEVHHVVPIQSPNGWEVRLAWDNLAALCVKCHNAAHGRWGGRRAKSQEGGGHA